MHQRLRPSSPVAVRAMACMDGALQTRKLIRRVPRTCQWRASPPSRRPLERRGASRSIDLLLRHLQQL